MQSDTLPRPNAFRAIGQTIVLNTVVNRLDAWARNRDWAKVGTRAWARNIRLGWAWDQDGFATNVFAHPYHGSLYFNTGRASGLSFLESAPIAMFGSWSWEYFCETERPSLNDFLLSSFGGVTLGEMFHRIGETIRDNTATGLHRTFRELAAMPFDPMGGLNRLFRGQWKRLGINPAEHDPKAYVLRVGVGGRFARRLVNDSMARMGTFVGDLSYGDAFAGKYRTPFDVFSIRLIVNSQGGLNALNGSGRLYGRALSDSLSHIRHQFAVNQRYDYVNNPAQSFGGVSVEAGIDSRWRLGARRDGFGIRTALFGDGIILGAIDAPGTGTGLRDYDFGPGAGVRWEAGLDRHGARFFTLLGRVAYIHTASGGAADHLVNVSTLELAIPVTHRVGIAVQTSIFDRESHYTNRPPDKRDYPEGRFMLVWTKGASTP